MMKMTRDKVAGDTCRLSNGLFFMMHCFLIILAGVLTLHSCTQTNSIDYFGQEPPGEIPKKFASGFISRDGRYELMTAFSPDGKEFCFTVTNREWTHFEIWITRYISSKWSEPQMIPLGPSGGFGPVFSPGNDTLFFSSGAWGEPPKASIWHCRRTQEGWAVPEKLGTPVNLDSDQWQSSIAADGTLLFCSRRPGGKGDFDVYISNSIGREYGNAVNMEILNSPEDEYSAFIAPDKSYIIFSSQCSGGLGWDDLYISFRNEDDSWSNPLSLGPQINTEHAEYSPHVTPDGKYLIYSKWDKESNWSNIYWVRADSLIGRLRKESDTAKDKN